MKRRNRNRKPNTKNSVRRAGLLAAGGNHTYQVLEPRILLAADHSFVSVGDLTSAPQSTELIELDFNSGGEYIKRIVAGDPNGNPPSNPNTIIDPNIISSPFAGVVSLNPVSGGNGALCSGTLLDSTHVITAGHCVDFNDNGVADISLSQTSVIFNHISNAVVYTGIAAVDVHPDYTGFNNPNINDDVAIITLNNPAPGSVPTYPVSQDPWNTPQIISLAGYGDSGTGTQGFTVPANFFVKRAGQNRASGFGFDDEGSGVREIFAFDFDGPTGATNTLGDGLTLGNNTEVNIGGGDSGGPSFLWDDANSNGDIEQSELTLFGINTYGQSIGGFVSPRFGSQGGGMVVASYLEFIDDFIDLNTDIQIGEIGTAVLTENWANFNFTSAYNNPVVIFGTLPTTQSTESLPNNDATVAVRNVIPGSGFEARLAEYDYQDGTTLPVEVSYFVIEAGIHTLENGTVIEVGQSVVTPSFQTINFNGNFAIQPVVFSQSQSFAAGSATVTRHNNVTTNSFEILLQGEQANGNPGNEFVGWMAIQQTAGTQGGLFYEAIRSPNVVTENNFNIPFNFAYPTIPFFVAQMQTFDDADTSSVRYSELTNINAMIYIDEESSSDSNITHSSEAVGYLAFEPGALFGPGAAPIPPAPLTGPSIASAVTGPAKSLLNFVPIPTGIPALPGLANDLSRVLRVETKVSPFQPTQLMGAIDNDLDQRRSDIDTSDIDRAFSSSIDADQEQGFIDDLKEIFSTLKA